MTLPVRNLLMEALGPNYTVRKDDATAETIDKTEFVVPYESKSFFVDVANTDTSPRTHRRDPASELAL